MEVESRKDARGAGMGTQALQINLERTADEAVIPPEYQLLLDVTAPLHGVHKATHELLQEIHHKYVGWPQTLTDLHRRAAGDFYHYNRHPKGDEALGLLSGLYAKIVDEAQPPEVQEDALRLWLHFLDKVVLDSGDRLERNSRPLRAAMSRLNEILAASPSRAAACSSWLKRLARNLDARSETVGEDTVGEAMRLCASALRQVYAGWLEAPDPVEWYSEIASSTTTGPIPESISGISHDHLRSLKATLLRLTDGGDLQGSGAELLNLPDQSEISRAYLKAAEVFLDDDGDSWDALFGRLSWLLNVLSHPDLDCVHERALQSIGRASGSVIRTGDPDHGERFVKTVFGQLRGDGSPHTRSVLDLVSRVGQAVLEAGDPHLTEILAEELLDLDFCHPDFGGFTDEWGVRVDPCHLENIRAYLKIIEVDPHLSRSLLAALVVHLKIGGVFVADTDLFQRDVSSLLARPIEPVYDQVKHFLKLLPVYFHDIGAEGELRDVSTRLDEIRARRDPVCHFLRKQSHVECNPMLVDLVVEIARFWTTGDPSPLRGYVPPSLYDQLDIKDENYEGLHRLFQRLPEHGQDIEALFDRDIGEIRERLGGISHEDPTDVEKAELLFRVHREITRKYSLDHQDVIARLRGFARLDLEKIERLERSLSKEDLESALDSVLGILEDLRQVIFTEGETEAVEDIYHKRHIAVGIPSMYGSYREPRFEAIGLTFRLESLGTSLFDRLIVDTAEPLDIDGLRSAIGSLKSLIRAQRIDGYDVHGLESCLSMLEQAVDTPELGGSQYIDILRLFCGQIEMLIQKQLVEIYQDPVEKLVARTLNGEGDQEGAREEVLKTSERFMRAFIAESFGLQRLDSLASRLLRQLREYPIPHRDRVAGVGTTGRGKSWVQRLELAPHPRSGLIHLGNKGFQLKRMIQFDLPVPSGFILTTDLFRKRAESGTPRLPEEVRDRVREEVRELERSTGYRFGDPAKPLLLSVRGGGPISMPGMLDSFLNVGISPEIAEGVARIRGHPWAAWDAYRRFIQLWGMSYGIDRDLFDDLMREAKEVHSVEKKSMLTADQMRELAFEYREFLLREGVDVVDDPEEQLFGCIDLAQESWNSENARLYRSEVQISDAWGTAVIVQNMVFGNLSAKSGTGVLMARRLPRRAEEVELYGDFVVQGQGDDVVSGLVETFPITESQRRAHPEPASHSLERDFPAIYRKLAKIARGLILDRGFADQEIEFTFESERPDDLFVLQTRDAILSETRTRATFEPGRELEDSRVAIGVGVSGGALSGRVGHNASDIRKLKQRFPDDPLILLRPDTVPDDIALVLQADGVLTAIGGATSHAAVVARRLGKTCVVGCRSLEVHERDGYSTVGSQRLEAGDLISINGMDGCVYFGEHPVTMVRIHGLTH